MASPVVQWVCQNMSKLLGIEATEDIAKYILAIDDRKELEEYMYELMDASVPENRKFIEELVGKWRSPGDSHRPDTTYVPDGITVYRKPKELNDDRYKMCPDSSSKEKKKGKQHLSNANNSQNHSPNTPSEQSPAVNTSPRGSANPSDFSQGKDMGAKKKSKFVPLFSDQGESKTVAKMPGRHPCECQAAKHPLVSNCTKCGRIVCQQEGSGPCIFCGTLVCSKEEQEILNRGSKKSDRLRTYLLGSANEKTNQSLSSVASKAQENEDKAIKHKNTLLEYDRTSVKRTQVIDDESDYFSTDSNTWLSKKEKEMLQKREEELRALKHASRKDRKVVLDFAGRRVLETDNEIDIYNTNDDVIQEVHFGKKKSGSGSEPNFSNEDFGDLVNPGIKQQAPQFVPTPELNMNRDVNAWSSGLVSASSKPKQKRIQDKELQEMADDGMAMSMHQPWASLLVAGIKKHEGRTWYTPHRGRLWIAATAKPPDVHEIAEVEQQYRELYEDANLPFPESYPVGCLLGSIDVTSCLSQEEYQLKFPGGESSCPFVFICDNPQVLLVKFPIKGKHKIYKIDRHIHQAAKKGVRHPKLLIS